MWTDQYVQSIGNKEYQGEQCKTDSGWSETDKQRLKSRKYCRSGKRLLSTAATIQYMKNWFEHFYWFA
jgi:hypothetical protein